MAGRCQALAATLEAEDIRAEVIDLRTVDYLSIDYETIVRSLKKTGMAVIVEEAPTSISIGSTIAAGIMDRAFDYLDGPIVRLTSADVPSPVSLPLETAALLSDERIVEAIRQAAKRGR